MIPARRVLFPVAGLLLGLLGAEVVARIARWRLTPTPAVGERNDGNGAEGDDRLVEGLSPPLFTLDQEILHPFLGFVQNPAVTETRTHRGVAIPRQVDRWGFVETWSDREVRVPPADAFRVAVVGGSMALMVTQLGDIALARALAPAVGREVAVQNWAMAGYKQPQQLLTVNYRLAFGERPDAVVNLDGYNDLVLGWTENSVAGVFPFYPRAWSWRVSDLPDPAAQRLVGLLAHLRSERGELAARFRHPPWSWSAVASLVHLALDRQIAAKVGAAEAELAGRRTVEPGYLAHGPPFPTSSKSSYVDDAVAVWSQSSRQLAALCKGLGIHYFHFLQPNQYVAGSKPMTTAERHTALSDRPAAALVRDGYHRLAEAGRELADAGISFHDLRQLFAEIEDPLYIDDCCHVSRRGNRLLGEAIGALMAAELRRPHPGDPR